MIISVSRKLDGALKGKLIMANVTAPATTATVTFTKGTRYKYQWQQFNNDFHSGVFVRVAKSEGESWALFLNERSGQTDWIRLGHAMKTATVLTADAPIVEGNLADTRVVVAPAKIAPAPVPVAAPAPLKTGTR